MAAIPKKKGSEFIILLVSLSKEYSILLLFGISPDFTKFLNLMITA